MPCSCDNENNDSQGCCQGGGKACSCGNKAIWKLLFKIAVAVIAVVAVTSLLKSKKDKAADAPEAAPASQISK